jgi:hypothetical protein
MANELPLLSSLNGELESFINSRNIGYFYKDEKDMINIISDISNNPASLVVRKKNCKNVFNEFFDSNVIYSDLVSHIQKVLNR